MPAKTETTLLLLDATATESAMLEAAALTRGLVRRGRLVQPAALSPQAAKAFTDTLGSKAIALRGGPSWLGRFAYGRLRVAPTAVIAVGVDAARAAQVLAGNVPMCVVLPGPLDRASRSVLASSRGRRALAPAESIICHNRSVSAALVGAGVPADRIQLLLPAISADHQPVDAARRAKLRSQFGLDAGDAPVFTVPRLIDRDQGHFRAGWAILLLRKGGVPARLLLPEPNREAARIARFAAAANEAGAIVTAPAGARWQDILAASDGLFIPGPSLCDMVAVARAIAGSLQIVGADIEGESLLLDETTCLASRDSQPLNLARAMLRVWEDRELAGSLTAAARQRLQASEDPAAALETCLQTCRHAAAK